MESKQWTWRCRYRERSSLPDRRLRICDRRAHSLVHGIPLCHDHHDAWTLLTAEMRNTEIRARYEVRP